jgi:hypothetical protein
MRIDSRSLRWLVGTWALPLLCLASARPVLAGIPCSVASNERVALVIGNSYSGADKVSGRADADAMAKAMCQLGFAVVGPIEDGSPDKMKTALITFRSRIAHARVAVFFFSGHGYQLDNANYLLPFGTTIDPAHPEMPLKLVMWSLSGAPDTALKLVFLDACRNNWELPVMGGGRLGKIPGWKRGLAKHPASAPPNTVFGFATETGQTAASGTPDGFSPYSSALLRSIREPGLKVNQLLDRAHEEVLISTNQLQSPHVEYDTSPDYWLRAPVRIRLTIDQADDDLFVVLHGKIVRARRKDDLTREPDEPIALSAGDNDLVLLLFNQKSYHNGQSWERTEGWSYQVTIRGEDGSPIKTAQGDALIPLADSEKHPFKDGPHHGQLFIVARANLHVDKDSAKLTVDGLMTDAASEAPFWAQQQEPLFEAKVKDLPVERINAFGIKIDIKNALELIQKLSGGAIDTDQLYASVWGNSLFAPAVHTCMVDEQATRLRELRESIESIFKPHTPRPFDSFDQALNACVKKVVMSTPGNRLGADEIRVWTAFEDRRQ